MDREYKYDVAFSCAEEDLHIAEAIATKFRELGISYYLYTEHKAEHWGKNIFKISLDKYGAEARFVLILISERYVRKHWSQIEIQIAQTITRVGEENIIPLQIDDISVNGLSKNIKYVNWSDNAYEIALLFLQKLKNVLKNSHEREVAKSVNINSGNGVQNNIQDVKQLIINNHGGEKK